MPASLESDLERMVAAARDDDREGLRERIELLRRAGGTRSRSRLIAVARDRQQPPEVRQMAVSVLGWIGGRGVVHTLTELVSALDETSGTRQAASIALGEIGGRKAVEALLGVLRVGGDPDVQVVAANSLGMIGSSRALESLIRIMGDRRHEAAVRGSAAEALGHLRDRRAVPALILAAFEDESAEVRYWATFALGEVGDKWMLPVLEHLAATDDVGSAGWGTVRDEAVAAIDRIRSGFGWQRQP